MSKIQIMSEDLSNKIAAGEVVERIANVVKELVENSIDAGAKTIKVELLDSGMREIKVTDDGKGMDANDALNAFKRHATSKIFKAEDLFFINTLGFRGEALPSIASVSKVSLITSEGTVGTNVQIEGGKLITNTKCSAPLGTIISIRDLFYNTPARLKYLKSEQTEIANTASFLEKLALSYPDISFYLSNNSASIIKTTGSANLLKTIHELYGLDISKNMLEIKESNDDYDLYGFISKPSILKSNRNYLTTIVNGRVVRNIDLNKEIDNAYHTYKPEGKYPVAVLIINTDPTLIDVNIHPTKQDIKFSKMNALKELISSSIKDALYKSLLVPIVEVKQVSSSYNEIAIKAENFDDYPELIINSDFDHKIKDEEVDYNEQVAMDFKNEEKNAEIKALELYPCGLVMGTYIIAQNDEAMYLIDQHAAAERINYESVLKALAEAKVSVTSLLIPFSLELSPSDFIKYKEHQNVLTDLGFKIEEFGINTIIIKAHPTWLITNHEEENTKLIIDLVINMSGAFDPLKFKDHLAATTACKMSVKGNEATTLEEAESLLNRLVKCDNPYNCPHGRPTIITFTKYEIEKMFKRVMN